MNRPIRILTAVACAALLGACASGDETDTPPGRDTGTVSDTGSDTSTADTGTDTAPDTGEDTTPDAEPDAEPDATEDATEDATPDAEPDATDLCADVDCSELGDACNAATCDPDTGECVVEAVEDGTTCEVGGCLMDGVCEAGACVGTPVEDGTACDDEDPCTTEDVCTEGACAGAELDCTALDGACAAGACDPESGECVAVPVEDGLACDTDACITDQTCAEGVCTGGDAVDCSGSDTACGVGTCNAETGSCETVDYDDGTACDDGGACTTGDVCTGGVCAGTAVDCSEGDDVCQVGFCVAEDGTCDVRDLEDGTACDDGDLCTVMNVCETGECTGTPVDCSALDDACNVGMCDPDTGGCVAMPREDGTACDDGAACTTGDVCTAGTCGGTPLDCSGLDDACNVGVCDVVDGTCVAAPVDDGTACDDGDLCTTMDACAAGVCTATPVDCSELDGECAEGVCDPDTGACGASPLADGTPCDDGDGCTDGDICGMGICFGTDLDCGEGLTACQSSTCDAELGACGPIVNAAVCSVCPEGVCGADGSCVAEVTEVAWDFEDGAVPATWTSTGDAPWIVTDADAATGVYSLANGDIGNSQTSGLVLSTNFAVPTTVSFAYRVSSETRFDFLRLFVDGVEVDSWSGTVPWATHTVDLEAGARTVEWRYTKDGSVSSGSDTAWIDDVTIQVTDPETVDVAFASYDFEGSADLPAAFTATGDANWFVSTETPYAGVYAAESGNIADNQVTSLELTATWAEAGSLSFWFRTSTETNYDYLELWIDGARANRWSGTIGWTQYTTAISAGAHTIEWRYDKDGSVSSGADTVWIDDVQLLAPSDEPVVAGDLCAAE